MRSAMIAIALILLTFCSRAEAGVVLYGTRIIYDGGQKAIRIHASNSSERAALTQAWLDDGDASPVPAHQRVPFVLAPAVRRLEQGEQMTYLLTYAPGAVAPLSQDRETLLYFNLLDIPPAPDAAPDSNLVQVAVRTRLKLFYRPAGLTGTPAEAAAGLRWRVLQGVEGNVLEVLNPTAYHVTFADISLADGTSLDADMVAPGEVLQIALPATTPIPQNIHFGWLDDFGRRVEQRSRIGP